MALFAIEVDLYFTEMCHTIRNWSMGHFEPCLRNQKKRQAPDVFEKEKAAPRPAVT